MIVSAIERVWLNLTVLEIYAINYCPTPVLFLVMAVMFFDKTKTPTSILCRIPQRTFKPSLVPIGQVVSEEKIFQRNNIKSSKKMLKKAITPTWLNRLK